MNSKITQSSLARLVAGEGRYDAQTCEKVLRQMFQCIAAALESGENVKVKGFGTFKLSNVASRKSVDVTSGLDNTIPEHRKIVFIPAKELAEAVNAPFEMFETVAIEENILEEELMNAESTGNEIASDSIRQELILEEEKMDSLKAEYPAEFAAPDSTPRPQPDPTPITVPEENSQKELPAQSEPPVDQDPAVEERNTIEQTPIIDKKQPAEEKNTLDEKPAIETKQPAEAKQYPQNPVSEIKVGKSHFWLWTIIIGLLVCIGGFALLFWLNDDVANWGRRIINPSAHAVSADTLLPPEMATIISNDENLAEENSGMTGLVEEEDPAEDNIGSENETKTENSDKDEVPTKPSDEKPVYDTVTETHYLSTIAKEHYGNFNFWPYIYKENEKILGHPNHIRPGTKVVVPPLSKYGVDPKNKEDIAKAKKMGVEIYNRYK